MLLVEGLPLHRDARFPQGFRLLLHPVERDQRIMTPVRPKNLLPPSGLAQFAYKGRRVQNITADADQPCQPVLMPKTCFQRHQAALGESEEKGLFRWKPGGLLLREQLRDQSTAPLNAGLRIARVGVPRISAVIAVRRIDQEDVQRGQSQHGRHPAETLHAVAQPMQNDEQMTRAGESGGNQFRG